MMKFFNDEDAWLFAEGTHAMLYRKLGAHPVAGGVRFALWAPDARYASVIGTFNEWQPARSPLEFHVPTGIWCGVLPEPKPGDWYKYHIDGADYPDQFGFAAEPLPGTASVIHDLNFRWTVSPPRPPDRTDLPSLVAPDRPYRELLGKVSAEAREMGFPQVALTHSDGGFAPPARLGTPEELVALVDELHAGGVSVGLRVPELGSEAATGQLRSIHLSQSQFWKEVYRIRTVLPLHQGILAPSDPRLTAVGVVQLYASPGPKVIAVDDKSRILVGTLNHVTATEPAFAGGWTEPVLEDASGGVNAILRRTENEQHIVLVVLNYSSETRANYRIGVPRRGFWRELLNTDAVEFGGSGQGNFGGVQASPVPLHGRSHSVTLTLPPFSALVLRPE